jgi:protein gp37
MNKTPIEWTNFTVNPFRFRNRETGKVGHHCTKISPGCAKCYSSKMQSGPYLSGLTFIEENKPKGEFFLDEAVLQQVLRRKKAARVFWCDMTDMFLEDYPDEWIDRCFAVMALTPHLTHQVLTKRSKRLREYFESFRAPRAAARAFNTCDWAAGIVGTQRAVSVEIERIPYGLPNIWLGVSVEDPPRADERIPDLLATPAAVRFLSVEPLLGPVSMMGRPLRERPEITRDWLTGDFHNVPFDMTSGGTATLLVHTKPKIDWVIVGGESGPGARPMHPSWARSLRDQCVAAGVPFFFKQWGEYCEWDQLPDDVYRELDASGEPPRDGPIRVGKKAAGRLLDGRTWDELPTVPA